MKVAIPTWNGKVSPVFDVATHLLVVDIKGGEEISRSELFINEAEVHFRVKQIASLGVDVIICGAISWWLEELLVSNGIQVISQICGDVEKVLEAFKSRQLMEHKFLMPGCCARRRRFRGPQRF
ncbi:MAG: dinitrogenase iron-molybdenum cofactor biosynthesis protein [Deltaproteobacteria bacterium]|nr:MAG: dinitrogenase iron-molybdenum cofactor biosynthesis protein [Deltaproteobacteria bacterium]